MEDDQDDDGFMHYMILPPGEAPIVFPSLAAAEEHVEEMREDGTWLEDCEIWKLAKTICSQ